MMQDILNLLETKKEKPEALAEVVIKNPKFLNEVKEGFLKDKASVKFGCEKITRIISVKKSEILYPHWEFFVKNLDNENNFIKWGAIIVISNLTQVDKKNKFEKIFNKYFGLIKDKKMITAANVVGNSWKIVKAKPHLEEKITKRILEIEKGKWETSECKNIIFGHAILSFEKYFDLISNKDKVREFVKKCLKNRRNATKKKAEKFLKKFGYSNSSIL